MSCSYASKSCYQTYIGVWGRHEPDAKIGEPSTQVSHHYPTESGIGKGPYAIVNLPHFSQSALPK